MYTLSASITVDEGWREMRERKIGRFILATNDLDLSPDELLATYKDQGRWNASSGSSRTRRFGSRRSS